MTKILIIEDEPFIRENLEDILALEGFETLIATDGLMGIQLAQQSLPDLIICDIMMPYGNGYEVITTLREAPDTEAIPFIFLTAKADRASLRQGMTLGADDYLTKPFTPQEVLGAVRARLKKQSAQAQVYQDQLQHLATQLDFHRAHDPATQLPNRFSLDQSFQALAGDTPAPHTHLAILYLIFGQLLSTRIALGPDLNQALVQQIGQRLETSVGVGRIAYLSDHQFAVVMDPTSSLDQAQDRAETLAKVFAPPIVLQQHSLFLSPKIGVALYPQDGVNLDELLLKAEMAAVGLPGQIDHPIHFYSADLYQQVKHRFTIEADLHDALDQQQIQVYYQPQFDIKTNQLVGAEALMRWFHPVRGHISPAHFIPIAEALGLIVPMGEWVLREACQQIHHWPQYPAQGHISVNLSARQFSDPNLLQTVMHILAQTGLPPQQLELEITETTLMQDADLAQQILTQFQQSGIQIAIDDFGVGYSSFNYLQRFALSTLKIDRCFVENLGRHPKNQKIVAAMIRMAHDLGMRVIAEGIEYQEEFDLLRELDCDIAQGYWCGRPTTSEEFESRYLPVLGGSSSRQSQR